MAFQNKIIGNPKTGQYIKFIKTSKDTNGLLLEMESTYNTRSKEPPAHYHPNQEEDFTVITGQLTVRMNGEIRIYNAGEMLHVPRNTVHSMWNNGNEKAMVNWKVSPAMETEFLLETFSGLAADNKTDLNGKPSLLQIVLLAKKYTNELRLAKPPFIIQKILFTILTPLAYVAGYKSKYKKYID